MKKFKIKLCPCFILDKMKDYSFPQILLNVHYICVFTFYLKTAEWLMYKHKRITVSDDSEEGLGVLQKAKWKIEHIYLHTGFYGKCREKKAKSIFIHGGSNEKLTCTVMTHRKERKWGAFSEPAWSIRSVGRWANVFCKIIIIIIITNTILTSYNMS